MQQTQFQMAVYCGTSLPLRKQQQISNNLTDTPKEAENSLEEENHKNQS